MTVFTPLTNADFFNGIRHYFGGKTLTIGSNGDDYTNQDIGLYSDSTKSYISSWDVSNISNMSHVFDMVRIYTSSLTGITTDEKNGDINISGGNIIISTGNISSAGIVSGNTLTDGTTSLNQGKLSGVVSFNGTSWGSIISKRVITLKDSTTFTMDSSDVSKNKENVFAIDYSVNDTIHITLPPVSSSLNVIINIVDASGSIEGSSGTLQVHPANNNNLNISGNKFTFTSNYQHLRVVNDGNSTWYKI